MSEDYLYKLLPKPTPDEQQELFKMIREKHPEIKTIGELKAKAREYWIKEKRTK